MWDNTVDNEKHKLFKFNNDSVPMTEWETKRAVSGSRWGWAGQRNRLLDMNTNLSAQTKHQDSRIEVRGSEVIRLHGDFHSQTLATLQRLTRHRDEHRC